MQASLGISQYDSLKHVHNHPQETKPEQDSASDFKCEANRNEEGIPIHKHCPPCIGEGPNESATQLNPKILNTPNKPIQMADTIIFATILPPVR